MGSVREFCVEKKYLVNWALCLYQAFKGVSRADLTPAVVLVFADISLLSG